MDFRKDEILSFVENILSILYGAKTRLTPEAAAQRYSCHFIEIAWVFSFKFAA